MKLRMLITFALLVTVAIAQAQTRMEFSQGLGHETNVFKNPGYYIKSGQEIGPEGMYQNGLFSYSKLDFSSTYSKDFFYMKLKAQGSTQQFFALEDAHSYRLNSSMDLRFKLDVNKYLHVVPSYSTYRQNGVDQGQGAIRTPLSYGSFALPLQYERRKKGIKRFSGLYYRFKNYPDPSGDELFYHSIGAQWNRERRFTKNKHRYLSEITMETSFRHYTDINFNTPAGIDLEEDEWEDDWEETVLIRNWGYAQAGYRIRRYNDKGYIEIPMRSFLRTDFSTQKYGYLQHDLGVNMFRNIGKGSLTIKAKVAHRHHFKLQTPDSTAIQYFYAGLDLKYEQSLSKRLRIFAQADVIKRFSNNDKPTSLAFREYFNLQAHIGLRYRF